MRPIQNRLGSLIVAAAAMTTLASGAGAAAIGAGANAPTAGVDTAGGTRTNVSLSDNVFLPAGSYVATDFAFNAGQSGNLQPFVAFQASGATVNGTASDGFTLVAAGTDNVVSSNGIQTVAFGGSSSFTVPAGGARIYLGITNSAASNPVFVVGSGTTDHQSPAFASPLTVGQTISGFNFTGLPRNYAYSIGIQSTSSAILINGGFETPSLGTGTNAFREGAPADGWTLVAGPVSTSGGGIVGNGSAYGNVNAPEGTQAGLLKSGGGMSQTIGGFTAGTQQYVVSFDSAGRDGGGPNPFQVTIGGTPLTFSGSTTITPTNNVYQTYTSDPFTVSSATQTLAFLSTLTDNQDLSSYVDRVSLTAVPEPSTLALAGFAAVGLLSRRRR